MLQWLKNFFTPPQIRERQNQLDFRVWLFSRSIVVVFPINFLILIIGLVEKQSVAVSAQLVYLVGGYFAVWRTLKDNKNINKYLSLYMGLCYMSMFVGAANYPELSYILIAWIPTLVLALYFVSDGSGLTFGSWLVINLITCLYLVHKMPPVTQPMLESGFGMKFAISCFTAIVWAIFYLAAEKRMVNGIIALIEKQREDNANLARILSHDISSPLQTASGYLPMLRKQGFDDKAGFLDKIQKALASINEIASKTRELLSLSSGRTKIELEPCNMCATLEDVIQTFELQLEKKKLKINKKGVQENMGLYVSADPILLKHQIFANLISNAVKFSHEGGEIDIEVTRAIGFLNFRIRDYGTGMTPEVRSRLFVLTRQGQGSLAGTAGEKGTGFGLLIVKTCLDAFGATIDIRSSTKAESATPGTEINICFFQAKAPANKQAA